MTDMGARRIFFPEMGKLGVWGRKRPTGWSSGGGRHGTKLPEADGRLWKWRFNNSSTERFVVTTNAQNTLQHFQRRGASAPSCPCLRAPVTTDHLDMYRCSRFPATFRQLVSDKLQTRPRWYSSNIIRNVHRCWTIFYIRYNSVMGYNLQCDGMN